MSDVIQTQMKKCLEERMQGSLALRFPEELETRFEQDQSAQRDKERQRVGILATILLNAFLYSDYVGSPASFGRSLLFRLGVFTPWAIMVLLLVRSGKVVKYKEALTLSTIVVGGFCVLAATPCSGPAEVANAEFGLLLVLFFGALTLALRFPYAVAAAVIVLTQGSVYAGREHWLSSTEILNTTMLMTTSAILALVSNYKAERGLRMAYLFYLREEYRGKSLARANRDLAELSNADGLTGLANRRHFDTYLRAVWETDRRERFPVSLILLDLDHFKLLNDTFGHLFGDHVLMLLAGILRSSIRDNEDMAARYGGEEFVILLPRQDREQAVQVAERLCREVRATPMVTVNGGHTIFVTISCGVATAQEAGSHSAEALIAQADGALYAAKGAGRDRVCVSAE